MCGHRGSHWLKSARFVLIKVSPALFTKQSSWLQRRIQQTRHRRKLLFRKQWFDLKCFTLEHISCPKVCRLRRWRGHKAHGSASVSESAGSP